MNQEAIKNEFMQAFTEYGDAIFRFSLVKVSNRELAEDMTQEVFTRYWQYLRDGRDMTNTRSFLYTIANNLAKDWYKKKKAESLDAKMETGFDVVSQASESSPQTMTEYKEILDVITDLEETDRTVLLLKYVDGLPPRDIADILDTTANAISVRITRAEKSLKAKLNHG